MWALGIPGIPTAHPSGASVSIDGFSKLLRGHQT